MKKNRSIRTVSLLIVCSVFLLATSIVAYYLSCSAKSNSFQIGENRSRIEERFEDYPSFEKGRDYEKKVLVNNTGSVDCYVRVFAELEDPEMASKLLIDYNTSDWTEKQEDGYYYYKATIKEGESTKPLFTTLHATETITDFRMVVYSETIQSDGFSTPKAAFGPYR